jgi:pimeloyl-ACP methyl ester carboxylesterase
LALLAGRILTIRLVEQTVQKAALVIGFSMGGWVAAELATLLLFARLLPAATGFLYCLKKFDYT